MLHLNTTIQRFAKQGEKTGWSYVEINGEQAAALKPGNRSAFRVSGKIDQHPIEKLAVMPMGNGSFIMALNAVIRKAIGKKVGAMVSLDIVLDNDPIQLNTEMMTCLNDEPKASAHFQTLTKGHQNYFSKWVDSAKSEETKARRIAMMVNALAKGWGYSEMIRDSQAKNRLLKS